MTQQHKGRIVTIHAAQDMSILMDVEVMASAAYQYGYVLGEQGGRPRPNLFAERPLQVQQAFSAAYMTSLPYSRVPDPTP